ncbi:MAG: helix-turn-helix domain-containing protein [Anaerolineaceae bacterium]|jgi:hypothetical protein|nr:helix-turn-helix domain-containing protein [Anaerolineaceae bacterium]
MDNKLEEIEKEYPNVVINSSPAGDVGSVFVPVLTKNKWGYPVVGEYMIDVYDQHGFAEIKQMIEDVPNRIKNDAEMKAAEAQMIEWLPEIMPSSAVDRMFLLSTNDVAEIIGVKPDTVKHWCQDGKVAGARKVNREWLIPMSALDRLKRNK